MRLRTQLVLLQSAIMLVVILGSGIAAAWLQERSLREAYLDRMIGVAYSVAQLPSVVEAFDDPDPSIVIQPIAETVREASEVTYVVVSDVQGVRYSHPNADRIGELVSTPPDAATSGELFVDTQTGTLGTSWRAKVPVFSADGTVIGQVSVGILESELQSDWLGTVWILGVCLAAAAIVGVVLASWAASLVRRRIYGVEPEEIKSMLETRNATLHGIGDGLVVLDEQGAIVLCNDAALRLLGREPGADLAGTPVAEVLDAPIDPLLADPGEQQLVLAGERMLVARVDRVVVDDRAVGTVLILRDRTELDAALRDLAGAQGMTETLRAQQHEFANTLHTLGGLLELGETEAAMGVIGRAGAGGALASLEPASGILELEVAALLLAKRAQAREQGVELVVRPGSTLRQGAAASDAGDWLTVLGNLVDNAMDASPSGRVEVGLDDVDTDTGRVVTIVVDDDGPGVPVARRAAIFDIDVSTKSHPAGLARGYGLTLVRRVAERLGGSAHVDDSPLGGARFVARLPVAESRVRA
ncbi:sensor histidine kinase [Agrococcus citreus]|uniref:histidine kinase n=2 Tax=Agrococcus citreus TaxID=84643 RepID=A0ABN1YSH6_9MICO